MLALFMLPSMLGVLKPMQTYAEQLDWGTYLGKSDSWYGTSEATAFADTIVQYQLSDGGWRKEMENTSISGSWAKSTIDNDATTSQIIVLARVFKKTNNEKYKNACVKGIDLLLNGQYSNGGWPQVFNDAGTYHAHITYNDTAMVRVLNILKDVSEQKGDFTFIDSNRVNKAKTSVEKGVRCILDTQISVNGVKTAWCQQHDENTLAPASARAYELPSISASESVGIVNFLKSLSNPSNEIIKSINAAVKWMDSVKLTGIKFVTQGDDKVVISDPSASPLWARFYEIGTNKPMFVDRDSSVHYNVSEISKERRTGYAWYGTWPSKLVAAGLLPETGDDPPQTYDPLNGRLIKNLVVGDTSMYSSWSIDDSIQTGDKLYGDRDFTYTAIPSALLGAEAIILPCDAKKLTSNLATFSAASDVSVFVAYDTRIASAPSWLSDWASTGMTAENNQNVSYNIYRKDYKAGETVTLGSNGTSSGCVNYTVLVSGVQAQKTLAGDVNCDGIVNESDSAALKRSLCKMATLSGEGYKNADVNGDNAVDSKDMKLLGEFICGKQVSFA